MPVHLESEVESQETHLLADESNLYHDWKFGIASSHTGKGTSYHHRRDWVRSRESMLMFLLLFFFYIFYIFSRACNPFNVDDRRNIGEDLKSWLLFWFDKEVILGRSSSNYLIRLIIICPTWHCCEMKLGNESAWYERKETWQLTD